jgi:N-acyl-D-aspartate/D-glutamate deacylase
MRAKARQEILAETSEEQLGREVVIACVESAANAGCEGETLAGVARQRKQAVIDALFDLLAEERLDVDALFFSMSEENLTRILQKDYVMIGSDASARDCEGLLSAGKPHPRGFGTFPRVLRTYVFERQLLSLECAIHKMTGMPAEKIGFTRRGLLRESYYADIVVFEPGALADRASYARPQAYPAGISLVLVNGSPVLKSGVHTGACPGRALLKGHT